MTERITTPASQKRRPTVAVLGAGIAGLTAAHELAERGFVVTVYESRPDERNGLPSVSAGTYPPVKLGGLAASQYSTVGTHDGSEAQLRPFPGRRGQPQAPRGAVAGEHGFRFFPAFYLHIWDLFQRIPIYQPTTTADGTTSWAPTSRTVYDNVRRVITKGITVDGQPSLIFPSELPRSPAEFADIVGQLSTLGFTPRDVLTYLGRLVTYLTSSPLRRAKELQNLSAYDFLVGYDSQTGISRYSYTPRCDAMLRQMPRILVALDSQWGDARTNMSTYLQLYLNMDRRDNKADGVLNGPTTEAWLDHWYRYLVTLGVRFVNKAATRLDPPALDPEQPLHLRSRPQIAFADGTRVAPDYTVVAVDAPAAESVSAGLRAAGTGGTVAGLDGFTTIPPPPEGPLQPGATRPQGRRDPYSMDEMGRVPWDRFQTLCGIQFYFDTEFQLLRGHLLLAGSEWALSSINQSGLWERRPVLERDGHFSVLSVDIGDFNTPSSHLVDEFGRGKTARNCSADEIAAEVWRQIVASLTSYTGSTGHGIMPVPVWYALDRGLVMAKGPGQGEGRVVRNESPYLVPIVGDWDNRPCSDPWNPHGTSLVRVATEGRWLEDIDRRNVWQARHGGYQVHNNSVVFAGTWTKTFTRVTSMESACESGRHAVNAILDHYIWVESGGLDRRESAEPLAWDMPYGFLDQGLSSPIRLPTPAGDYAYVFDIENREPADTRPLRMFDQDLCDKSLPHPLDGPAAPPIPPLTGGQQMMTPTTDYNQQMLAYLSTWQRLLEQWTTMAMGLTSTTAPIMPPAPQLPQMPFMPPFPPGAPPPPASTDYAQQLFSSLQAWRQHLEQMATGRRGVTPTAESGNSAQGGPAQPTGRPNQSGHASQSGQADQRPSDVINLPPINDGTRNEGGHEARDSSNPTPPPWIRLGTRSQTSSMEPVEVPGSPTDRVQFGPVEMSELKFPARQGSFIDDLGQRLDPEIQAPSAFREAMGRVDPNLSPQSVQKSLFAIANEPAANIGDAGQTPSP
ncbi:FAD-dependent oxidoreductase [Mycolicibacterium gadium]|uniref:NAD(P)-binding protein n=1 Tax=Mycolicibacterium gadium TaxID=1794 RepID=A0ABT6GJI2_MYCGU|nr:FAD-dependent oxidoreductase [Mycolicibacterium gadium]MDG5481536.1 NAD(P)-binding protein [Mycolicibacterium gadium]